MWGGAPHWCPRVIFLKILRKDGFFYYFECCFCTLNSFREIAALRSYPDCIRELRSPCHPPLPFPLLTVINACRKRNKHNSIIFLVIIKCAALRQALWSLTSIFLLSPPHPRLNGLCTSFGWPSLAKIFVNWFTDPAERGKWYSILSTNQNIGSAMIPFVSVLLIYAATLFICFYIWQLQ